MNIFIINIQNLNVQYNTSVAPNVCTTSKQNQLATEYNKDKIMHLDYIIVVNCVLIANRQYRDNNRQINANRLYTKNDIKTF